MRPYHYLRQSKSVGFPRHQIALSVIGEAGDVSTDGHSRPVKLTYWRASSWTGAPGEESSATGAHGTDADSWWRYLTTQLRKGITTWIWQVGACHGLTLLGMWEHLSLGTWTLGGADPVARSPPIECSTLNMGGLCVVEDPPTIILARPTGAPGMVRWVDVRNLGVAGWAELGCTPGDTAALAEWLQEWSRTVRDLNLGGLRHTAAAQAWHGWRHAYMTEGVLIHDHADALRLERDALYAGRAECYRVGRLDGPIYQLDATAHYPSVARASSQPCRLRWHGICTTDTLSAATARGYLAIVRCRVRTAVPCLPHRRADDTIYPVGEWDAALCGPEYALAERLGHVLGVSCVSLYEPGDSWGVFMSALWRARTEAELAGHVARRSAIKRLMNSAIGKCAAHGWSWTADDRGAPPADWCTWYAPDYDTGELVRWRAIGWQPQRREHTGEHPESCPQLAAWVYSLGRVKLWEWITIAGLENVHYVDTDCVYCTEEGYRRLVGAQCVSEGTLGALRLQYIHSWMVIHGIKDYETPQGRVCSGVPTRAVRLDDGGYSWWCPETIPDTIRQRPEGRAPLPVLNALHRSERTAYTHGTVMPDGRVRPLEV